MSITEKIVLNNDYYITLANILESKFKDNKEYPYHTFAYNGLIICKDIDYIRIVIPYWGRPRISRDVYWVVNSISSYGNNNYTLSSRRLTLAAALRTADRILERGFDEWKRPLQRN